MNLPYHPTLMLGHLADDTMLRDVRDRNAIQAQVDAAQRRLNSLVWRKRSIDMRIQELIDRRQDSTALRAESASVENKIEQASLLFAQTKIGAQWQLETLKLQSMAPGPANESPLDLNKSKLRKLPLAVDALKMNVQYFAFDEGAQRARLATNAVQDFIHDELLKFGEHFSEQAGAALHAQLQQHHALHDNIAGTLVISINCLHKNALQLLPFMLDADKAVRVWNSKYPGDPIDTDSLSSASDSAATASDEHILQVVSGATYGSCCIGMIHLIDAPDRQTSDSMYSVADSMHGHFELGDSFAGDAEGGDAGVAAEAMRFLKSSQLRSLCSLVTLGATLQPKSPSLPLAAPGAAALESHGQMEMAPMIAALDDYVQDALAGQLGMPVDYTLTPITKEALVARWIEKYQYFPMSNDGAPPCAPATAAGAHRGVRQAMGGNDMPGAVFV